MLDGSAHPQLVDVDDRFSQASPWWDTKDYTTALPGRLLLGHSGIFESKVYVGHSLLPVTILAQRAPCEAQSQRRRSRLTNPHHWVS